jgi:hypothetical protein
MVPTLDLNPVGVVQYAVEYVSHRQAVVEDDNQHVYEGRDLNNMLQLSDWFTSRYGVSVSLYKAEDIIFGIAHAAVSKNQTLTPNVAEEIINRFKG